MSENARYAGIPEQVKARMVAGELPSPRLHGEPDDPIRDVTVEAAVAEAEGNWAKVDRLHAQRLDLARRGHETSWQPQRSGNGPLGATTRDDLLDLARKADEAGDHDRAHDYKVRAMHAPDRDGLDAVKQSNGPEAGEYDKADALRVLRGDPEHVAPKLPAQPQTAEEFHAAIRDADANGDHAAADRHRLGLLYLNRQRQERAVTY